MSLNINAKIPFQSGLSLGSIVKGDVIQKMEDYAEVVAKTETVPQEIRTLEFELNRIKGKITQIEQKKNKTTAEKNLENVFKNQQKVIQAQKDKLDNQVQTFPALEFPSFSSMLTGLESPIDFNRSHIITQSRGFDSINFSSQYIDMSESDQRIEGKLDQSSSASSLSLNASGFFLSVKGTHSWSKAVMDRVYEIKKQGYASKILLISAFITTRHVRLFKDTVYDSRKLRVLLRIMKNSDPSKAQEQGITVEKDGSKSVNILTEAVMGGSFSAIVTYLKEDTSSQDAQHHLKHSASNSEIEGKAGLFLTVKGGYSNASQQTHESHHDEIHNQGNLHISIQFIAQGAIPQLAREKVMQEALRHQAQHLRKYESLGGQQQKQDNYAHQLQLQKVIYTAANAIQKTAVQQEAISVHTPSSVIGAYDDFCSNMIQDQECGVPIGFNYTVLSQQEIEEILGESADVNRSQLDKREIQEEALS
ncbi:MAG: hypothetical protein QRY72_00270 [Candidatus Rhabdochlamydia sp.]